jgi:hypothetical protein
MDLTRTYRSMTTNPALAPVDTHDPVYTIEHVAALFHVKVDTAREYTSARTSRPPTTDGCAFFVR